MLALSLRVLISALFLGLLASANPVHLERRSSRTSPPSGAVVVRPSNPGAGEFTSVQAAVNSLPNDSSSRTIFIFPGMRSCRNFTSFHGFHDVDLTPLLRVGTYSEQVVISRSGPLTVGFPNQFYLRS